MRLRFALLITLQCGIAFASFTLVHAQAFDPYRRLNDPLAVADLGGPDSAPIMRVYDVGSPAIHDTDGYGILAGDTGSGVIRHLGVTYDPDTNVSKWRLKLWVDDSLLIDDIGINFFVRVHGMFRNPFDTSCGGGFNSETQIPYRHNFRWTSFCPTFNWEAGWQRVDSTIISSCQLNSSAYSESLTTAESNYWSSNPWSDGTSVSKQGDINSGDTLELADLQGPAYVENLHFHFPSLDTAIIHNLWIEMFWDNSPSPSVEMPVSDFFGISTGARNMNTFRLKVDSLRGLLDCYFPMPFKVSARIILINKNRVPVTIDESTLYKQAEWKPSLGYFAAQYHITPDISLHLLHPVLHIKGAGRCVGVFLMYPFSIDPTPVFIEGYGYFSIDSMPYGTPVALSQRYRATEDYCEGGWYFASASTGGPYFMDGNPFSLPFYGCPNRWGCMYRFHINDPMIYSKSLDVVWGHGFNDDYTTTYRTAAFYYEKWIPYYPSSDSIAPGNIWKITGAGYAPDTEIVVTLDTSVIYRGQANADGSIDLSWIVPASWASGPNTLSINGSQSPEQIVVLPSPKLCYVQDSAGRTFDEGDSIEIRGYGFQSREQIKLFLGDTQFKVTPQIIADSDGVFRLKTYLPWVPESSYRLQAEHESGELVASDSMLNITRTLNFEFEKLPVVDSGNGCGYNYLSFSDKHWSQGAIEFCFGNWKFGSSFAFQFNCPFADTFAVTVFGTLGNRYAIYRTWIDSVKLGAHDWFLNSVTNIIRDSDEVGRAWLTAGLHVIRFVNEGADDSTVEYSIGPDNFHLSPISPNSQAGTPILSVTQVSPSLYPDPVTQDILHVQGLNDGNIRMSIYSAIGQRVMDVIPGPDGAINISSLPNGNFWLVDDGPARNIFPFAIFR